VIKYVEDNYDVISDAMILSNKEDKLRKHNKKSEPNSESDSDSKVKIKKHGITIRAIKKVKNKGENNEAVIILSFD